MVRCGAVVGWRRTAAGSIEFQVHGDDGLESGLSETDAEAAIGNVSRLSAFLFYENQTSGWLESVKDLQGEIGLGATVL